MVDAARPRGEPPSDAALDDTAHARAYRRRFKQKDRYDDYALDLFREARARLTDIAQVKRVLLELGRFYNPLLDGPIVDLSTRVKILDLLEQGRRDEAAALLDERCEQYLPRDEPPDRQDAASG